MQESRRYDHVYDPTYTTASSSDFARLNSHAVSRTAVKVAHHENFFSEIPAVYKPYEYRVATKADLPSHVDTSYHAAQPNTEGASVSGANRAKYFSYGVSNASHGVHPSYLLAKLPHDSIDAAAELANKTGPVSMGTQTMYRESDAQTDAYSPDYIIPKGANPNPEILSLAHLKYGETLPPTMKEVQEVERARIKAEFLENLPPITDEASAKLRKRLMEENEVRELGLKAYDIDVVNEEHLRRIKDAIEEREAEREFVNQHRLESLKQNLIENKDKKILEIQKSRIKTLRKLTKKRAALETDNRKRDIIKDFSDFSSKKYVPLLRDGARKDSKQTNTQQVSNPQILSSIDGVHFLESELKPHHLNANIAKPKLKQNAQSKQLLMELDRMEALMKDSKSKHQRESPTPNNADQKRIDNGSQWRKKAEKLERPQTPRILPQDTSSDLDDAITLIQKLITGRAIQNMMYAGRMKRQDLINELRIEECFDEPTDDAKEPVQIPFEVDTEEIAWGAIQGEVISSTLDFMTKEMSRVNQEQEIQNMIYNADERRRNREMVEAGTRQAELLQREAEERIYEGETDIAAKNTEAETGQEEEAEAVTVKDEVDVEEPQPPELQEDIINIDNEGEENDITSARATVCASEINDFEDDDNEEDNIASGRSGVPSEGADDEIETKSQDDGSN